MSDPLPPPCASVPEAAQPAVAPPTVAMAVPPIAAAPEVKPEGIVLIGIDDFYKVKLVTGEVVSAVPHPKADRLLILQVKVGAETKQIVSGIRQFYTAEQMVGKTIIVVNNLQPSKLRGEMSFGMLLAVRLPEGGLRLVTTDGPAQSGLEVS
jgi:methionyl-tRNA synthetase